MPKFVWGVSGLAPERKKKKNRLLFFFFFFGKKKEKKKNAGLQQWSERRQSAHLEAAASAFGGPKEKFV